MLDPTWIAKWQRGRTLLRFPPSTLLFPTLSVAYAAALLVSVYGEPSSCDSLISAVMHSENSQLTAMVSLLKA